ncbi:cold shock domain-containing protein [Thiomicrorhabdus sp. 6S2-11]|uniref:Cold shock domain-containing protein n=1 Tax=Thiomicrorhabdus marina TaxID=2818442 RepID=A0ABS3Q2S8_9GAMM|nr:cold shock domain-containing protein [Thiomicrorhabdus marina]MBO1926637.1 cold shock domain-containing protein [Thiomicrorhabdus marina]
MKGYVSTFLPQKKYGFLKGEDDKDYFFHTNDFTRTTDLSKLAEESYVEFEPTANPKGYAAKKCKLINANGPCKYIVPDEFITSRSSTAGNWNIINQADWIVHGSSRDSPDHAKRDAIEGARMLGANSLLYLDYYKTTGSEAGTGNGTYYYTVHNFCGRPCVLGRKHAGGAYAKSEFTGLNEAAENLKNRYLNMNAKSKRNAFLIWSVVLVTIFVFQMSWPSFLAVIAGFIWGRPSNHGAWLQKG